VRRPCDFADIRREEPALRAGFFFVAVFLAPRRELAEAFRFRAPQFWQQPSSLSSALRAASWLRPQLRQSQRQ